MQEVWTTDDYRRYVAGEHVPQRLAPRSDLTQLVVTLPVPDKATHPNTRANHWIKKSKAAKKQRTDAGFAAKHALRELGSGPPLWERVTIQATYHRPDSHSPSDQMNLIGWLKHYEDGLQDAGVVRNDRGVTWLPPVELLGQEATEAKVVLTITPTGAPQ